MDRRREVLQRDHGHHGRNRNPRRARIPSKNLPSLPAEGIAYSADMHTIRGAKVVDGAILWGPKPGLSATLHQDVHRNLYRVALQ